MRTNSDYKPRWPPCWAPFRSYYLPVNGLEPSLKSTTASYKYCQPESKVGGSPEGTPRLQAPWRAWAVELARLWKIRPYIHTHEDRERERERRRYVCSVRIDRQTERQTDRQIDRIAGKQMGRWIDR